MGPSHVTQTNNNCVSTRTKRRVSRYSKSPPRKWRKIGNGVKNRGVPRLTRELHFINATWLSENANINTFLCTEFSRRMHADYYNLSSVLCVLLQQSTLSSSHVGSLQTSGSDRGIPCHSPSSIPRVAMVITSPQVLYIRYKTLLTRARPRGEPLGCSTKRCASCQTMS